jgi:hypothetical protein
VLRPSKSFGVVLERRRRSCRSTFVGPVMDMAVRYDVAVLAAHRKDRSTPVTCPRWGSATTTAVRLSCAMPEKSTYHPPQLCRNQRFCC